MKNKYLRVFLLLISFQFIPCYLFAQDKYNTIIEGNARFQVLSSTLIRMEYAGDGYFDDRKSFVATNREFINVDFKKSIKDEWLTIETDKLKLQYQIGSGPFSNRNTIVVLKKPGKKIYPFSGENEPFLYSGFCEAEYANFWGGANNSLNHSGYFGTGYIDNIGRVGATVAWKVYEIPTDGKYTLTVRYANGIGKDNKHKDRKLSLFTNGIKSGQVEFPKTNNWNSWTNLKIPVTLNEGKNNISFKFENGDDGNINIDHIYITKPNDNITISEENTFDTIDNLGGWSSSLDQADGPVQLKPGLLTKNGWFLLNDSNTKLWTDNGWLENRKRKEIYQDGYFFGYGDDYKVAMLDFINLTGKTPLLPRYAFGVWFSRYCPFSSGDYKEIVKEFRAKRVPLEVLVIDTDFKSPNSWNGWSWNTELFPNPKEFINWKDQEGLHLTLNIHADIMNSDPKFNTAQELAENSLINLGSASGSYTWIKKENGRLPVDSSDIKYGWNWNKKQHVKSYFWLHEDFEKLGVDFWWLDAWSSQNWINHLYANRLQEKGKRPIHFARIAGDKPWVEHRSTIHFTGDSHATWELLDFIPYFTISEGNIGLSYISHDIGSHLGGHLPDDLYLRWVQMGTFMPILRLHSSRCNGSRLPWEYNEKVEKIATKFLRLRHQLIPYTYSIARQSYDYGLPIVRGMYFDYPEKEEAYSFDHQYMFGDQILVAPVTSPGENVQKKVWLPKGKWYDYFSGEEYQGSKIYTINSSLNYIPVFVKAGGIIPHQSFMKKVSDGLPDTLVVNVYPGSDGEFYLYEDDGKGLNYQDDAYAYTKFKYIESSNKKLVLSSANGSFPNQPQSRNYVIKFFHVNKPEKVIINGSPIVDNYEDSNYICSYNNDNKVLLIRINNKSINERIDIVHNASVIKK